MFQYRCYFFKYTNQTNVFAKLQSVPTKFRTTKVFDTIIYQNTHTRKKVSRLRRATGLNWKLKTLWCRRQDKNDTAQSVLAYYIIHLLRVSILYPTTYVYLLKSIVEFRCQKNTRSKRQRFRPLSSRRANDNRRRLRTSTPPPLHPARPRTRHARADSSVCGVRAGGGGLRHDGPAAKVSSAPAFFGTDCGARETSPRGRRRVAVLGPATAATTTNSDVIL